MPTTQLASNTEAATALLAKYTEDVDKAAAENEQDEEIESMLASAEVDDQAVDSENTLREPTENNKRAKLDVYEASLKSASSQVVVQNTLTEYARFVIGHVGHVATNF
jgi:hypothetical protein